MNARTANLKNVTVLPSGQFIISNITSSDNFQKPEIKERAIDSFMDLTLFAEEIATVLNITVRFVSEEPLDKVKKQYKDTMKRILLGYGIEFVEIKSK